MSVTRGVIAVRPLYRASAGQSYNIDGYTCGGVSGSTSNPRCEQLRVVIATYDGRNELQFPASTRPMIEKERFYFQYGYALPGSLLGRKSGSAWIMALSFTVVQQDLWRT
jgi:hypothetical protein